MINTTDLQELEVSLPGDWLRKDTGDTYRFTADRMRLNDERLFRELHIRHPDGAPEDARYALSVADDYLGIVVNQDEFVICRLVKHRDGSAAMEWKDRAGGHILFERLPEAASHV